MHDPVVVRFAPSPTGPLHIGGLRTALYNHLLVKQRGGRCILRIEDTDQNRYVPGAEDHIKESLQWLGIQFNEGVEFGGDAGPYRQSERKELYRQYTDRLLDNGHAYIAFDTPEELNEMREQMKAAGQKNLQYNYISRNSMKNSLTLPEAEVKARIQAGDPYVVRMKMPRKEEIRFYDIVRKWVVFQSNQLDDKVLVKSDGMPTYHLANVVDDYLMQITHVIRGEEWLSSTPLHVLLYRALGWENSIPNFIHLPLILNPNGVGKMSKRQGDKLGFSVFPINWEDPEAHTVTQGYREQGYLPEALMNFLALLGWNPGTDEEVMDEARLVELFSLERINNSATNFDIEKLKWFNQVYIRQKDPVELLPLVKEQLQAEGYTGIGDAYLLKVIALLQERVTFVHEFVSQGSYLFETPNSYDPKMLKKRWNEEARMLMGALRDRFEALEDWQADSLHQAFQELIAEKQVGNGKVLAPLRLVLTGLSFGPGAFDIAELIGKSETLLRMDKAITELAV